MAEALGELWRDWARGPGDLLLAAEFVVLSACWVASVIALFVLARRSLRSPGPFTLIAVATTLLVATVGVSQPSAFPSWSFAALGTGTVVGALLALFVVRTRARCPEGHLIAPTWKFCPLCPSTLPTRAEPVETKHVSSHLATVLRRPGLGGQPAPPPRSESAPASADILMWLVPEAPGAPDVAIQRPGAVVGRDPVLDICIDDPGVSWNHAKIVSRNGVPALIDNGSSNGTWVNGERVEESLLLADDRIRFGDTSFRVVRP